ncbi:3D domain-containing protein [Patescibacteria group bacterium]|nr:3D domain-containing protein [Patescibacteria group bacterium]
MRIIRLLVALPMIWTMVAPQHALAVSIQNANETKINFTIPNNLNIVDGKLQISSPLLSQTPYNFEGYEPIKTPVELKREKILSRFADRLKNAILPKEEFTINASAYTAAADECGKSDGITASGVLVKENRTIACPPGFPFGVKIKIKGMGTYVCEDRGGAIKGNHFDIYMQTKKQAFAFGRRNLLAQVIQ